MKLFSTLILCTICLFIKAQNIKEPLSYQKPNENIYFTPKNEELNYQTEYFYCSEEGDGFTEINVDEITEIIYNSSFGGSSSEAIFISTNLGHIIKIYGPNYNNSSIELVCPGSYAYTDVAVDEFQNIYYCTSNYIARIDTQSCYQNVVLDFEWGTTQVNALSFDPLGNLLFGEYTKSEVYRWNADQVGQPYVWHDFDQGGSGGDFVMLNGKLYISWRLEDDNYRLYEVTVDSDFNYVSHNDIGQLPNKTYGLASEFGVLYGVTPNTLIKINPENFGYDLVLYNDGTYGDWWGTAGLHEASVIETSAHLTYNDANNNTNDVSGLITNTTPGEQVLYIRIENIITGEFEIIEINIIINNKPQTTKPNDLVLCSDEISNTFVLTDVELELLINYDSSVLISYHLNQNDALENINPIDSYYETISSEETIFVRVQNSNNDCFSIEEFNIIRHSMPIVPDLVDNSNERSLNNCYINQSNNGYFLLDEIYNQVVMDDSDDIDLTFFLTYNDALNDINILQNIYYLQPNDNIEIFVKVNNSYGCSDITNFYLDGNCLLNSSDVSGIFFPQFFSPNYDGINDYWNINGISKKLRASSIIYIYDRYGKLLFQFKPSETQGWDGSFNGSMLPSSDYWFKLKISTGQIFKNHFSLIR